MDDCEKKVMSDVLRGLVAQNLEFGQRLLGLQNICSKLLEEISLLHPDPEDKIMRLSAELNGTAAAISNVFRTTSVDEKYAEEYCLRGLTAAVERVTLTAEDAVRRRAKDQTPPKLQGE